MTLSAKFSAPIGTSHLAVSDLSFVHSDIAAINGAGIVHFLSAVAAQTDGVDVQCNDLVTGAKIVSTYDKPAIDAAINGRPTVTHGSGSVGTTGAVLAPKRYGELDIGTGSWSMCMLVRAMGTGSTDTIVSPERAAAMVAGKYSPYLRFTASGDKTLAPALIDNAGSLRSVCNTKEFYNTNRVLLLCGTPGVGVKWYVDNWSSPEATSTTDAAKAAFTDGKFVLAGPGWTLSSLTFAGSWGLMTFHNVDLSLKDPARRDLMKAIASYGGITSD